MERLGTKMSGFLESELEGGYVVTPIAGDASDRRYYRAVKGDQSLIVMDSSRQRSRMPSFVSVRQHLSDNGYSVPEIYCSDMESGFMVLEDFGEHTLDQHLSQNPDDLELTYGVAVDIIASLGNLEDPPLPVFDEQFFFRELSVFTRWYMQHMGKPVGYESVDKFKRAWREPLSYLSENDKNRVFVHKDLHCGNVFWLPDREGKRRLGLIDFQSAKSGSYAYDVTSFLYDCRRPLPETFREEMLGRFASTARVDADSFGDICDIWVAQRNIKILGNFTHIAQEKGNPFYLRYLPRVWEFIDRSLENPMLEDVRLWMEEEGVAGQF